MFHLYHDIHIYKYILVTSWPFNVQIIKFYKRAADIATLNRLSQFRSIQTRDFSGSKHTKIRQTMYRTNTESDWRSNVLALVKLFIKNVMINLKILFILEHTHMAKPVHLPTFVIFHHFMYLRI